MVEINDILTWIQAFTIYQWIFPGPLVNCLQLQHLLRGIKRHQGSSLPQHQPVTADFMRNIQPSLEAHNSEHIMLWAACCLGFFGFLRAGEFTVNCAFDPSIHLTVQDLQVDAEANPSSLRVPSKVLNLTLFARDVLYTWGVVRPLFVQFRRS